jgi:hypothetical protein
MSNRLPIEDYFKIVYGPTTQSSPLVSIEKNKLSINNKNYQNGLNNNNLQIINTITITQNVIIVVIIVGLFIFSFFAGVIIYNLRVNSR